MFALANSVSPVSKAKLTAGILRVASQEATAMQLGCCNGRNQHAFDHVACEAAESAHEADCFYDIVWAADVLIEALQLEGDAHLAYVLECIEDADQHNRAHKRQADAELKDMEVFFHGMLMKHYPELFSWFDEQHSAASVKRWGY